MVIAALCLPSTTVPLPVVRFVCRYRSSFRRVWCEVLSLRFLFGYLFLFVINYVFIIWLLIMFLLFGAGMYMPLRFGWDLESKFCEPIGDFGDSNDS